MDFKLNLNLPQTTALSTEEEKQRIFDVGILGGGPAGMTAAVYTSRKQLSTVIISPDLGGQVLTTSGVENYMGFQYITGPELATKFSEHIRHFTLKWIQQQASKLEAKAEIFTVHTDAEQQLKCKSIIIATGKRWRDLEVRGEQTYRGRGVSYCSVCDGPFFRGKPVLVVGGGNSALTAAVDMLELGSRVTLVNLSPQWQADEVLMEKVQGKAEMFAEHAITEIVGDGNKVTGAVIAPVSGGQARTLDIQGIFIEIGLIPNTAIFKDLVQLNAENEIVVDCVCRTSQPGIFAAGDCTQVPEKQIVVAAGEGAKAALAAYRLLKRIPAEKNACA